MPRIDILNLWYLDHFVTLSKQRRKVVLFQFEVPLQLYVALLDLVGLFFLLFE